MCQTHESRTFISDNVKSIHHPLRSPVMCRYCLSDDMSLPRLWSWHMFRMIPCSVATIAPLRPMLGYISQHASVTMTGHCPRQSEASHQRRVPVASGNTRSFAAAWSPGQ